MDFESEVKQYGTINAVARMMAAYMGEFIIALPFDDDCPEAKRILFRMVTPKNTDDGNLVELTDDLYHGGDLSNTRLYLRLYSEDTCMVARGVQEIFEFATDLMVDSSWEEFKEKHQFQYP